MHTHIRETFSHGVSTRERLFHCNEPPRVLSRVGIEAVGIVECANGYEIVRLQPTHAIVQYMIEGDSEVLVDGRWTVAEPGMAYVLPPGVTHGYRTLPDTRSKRAWIILQDPSMITCAVPTVRHAAGLPFVHAIEGLLEERSTGTDRTNLDLWIELVIRNTRNLVTSLNGKSFRLQPVWNAVSRDMAREWDLCKLAKIASISEESLRRICKKETGMSPMQKVTDIRMHSAAYMLRTYPHSIDRVASQVGYANAFAFSVAFKRWSGNSPSKYRFTSSQDSYQ